MQYGRGPCQLSDVFCGKHRVVVPKSSSLLPGKDLQYRRPRLNSARRSVAIVFVVESVKAGNMTLDAISSLGSRLADAATIYVWPENIRDEDPDGHTGAMHVKCAVADDDVAFISSANLTEHALSISMELGLLVRGDLLPQEIREHFQRLADEKTLVRITSNPGRGR